MNLVARYHTLRKLLLNEAGNASKSPVIAKQVGSSPERWYATPNPVRGGSGSTTGVIIPINALVAMPFISAGDGTLDRIAFRVTTGGAVGSKARCGIYANTSPSVLYPSTLILDGGEMTTTTMGNKATTINQDVKANVLYWFAYICGVAAPTVLVVTTDYGYPILGQDGAFSGASNGAWSVPRTYGALPETFPASASATTTQGAALVAARYSA